jgi:hypothetical protein
MKITHFLLPIMLFLLVGKSLYSQSIDHPLSSNKISQESPVLFGTDVVINNEPNKNQYQSVICSAFNGWLYAGYAYNQDHFIHFNLMKSIDNGLNWTILRYSEQGSWNDIIIKMDITTSGTNENDIRVFFGKIYYDTLWQTTYTSIPCVNGNTGALIGEILNEPNAHIYDFDIESDVLNPAGSSNPNSIAVLYSKSGTKDSIIYRSSSNGGISLNYRKTVAITNNHFGKVSLSYGKVPSWNTGRYFGVWEELNGAGAVTGHIYSAHSEPNFNSPFTTPKCLDSLNSQWINQVRNPVVACQSGDSDNSNGNLTEVVLFERLKLSSGDVDIVGGYNLQAASSVNFQPLTLALSETNEIQPDICYNPHDSKFMVTYYNEVEKKLPFLNQDVNIPDPGQWNLVTSGYNDSSNISSPFPKVRYSSSMLQGINIWNARRSNTNGCALFDASYLTYTSTPELNGNTFSKNPVIFPNPCNSPLNYLFELEKGTQVMISLTNIMEKRVRVLTDRYFPPGRSQGKLDLSKEISGYYIVSFTTDDNNTSIKLLKVN